MKINVEEALLWNVEELVKKAFKENWQIEVLNKWLRIKEVQCLEKMAYSKVMED